MALKCSNSLDEKPNFQEALGQKSYRSFYGNMTELLRSVYIRTELEIQTKNFHLLVSLLLS